MKKFYNQKLIEKNLKNNGYAVVKSFFLDCSEFKKFNNYLNNFLINCCNEKNFKREKINKKICQIFKKKPKISGYLNDNVNLSINLASLFTSNKLLNLISKVLKRKKEKIIFNNQRFRIQIPGNDEISNLPWHQDIHYNNVKNTSSVVAWISLSDISEQMGPITFKKRSHKLKKIKPLIMKKKNGGYVFKVDVANSKIQKLKNYSTQTCSGDLILIDMCSLHTSGVNKTRFDIKYSAQARYHAIKKFK